MEPTPQDPRVRTLLDFVSIPSISAQAAHRDDVARCAAWLADLFTSLGMEAAVEKTPGHPIVVGRTPHDPARGTLLIYGHYDVQPPDPLDLWESPPFEPVVRDGRVFGRGSSDNKGQILAHILGVGEALAKGALPMNVVFLVEGEEEIGSPHLAPFLERNREALACDAIAISDTGMAAHGHPTLSYALRGIACMEVHVHGPSHDLHSGIYGGTVPNPATVAARLIASLHDAEGRIAIEGFLDAVQPLREWEREAAAESPLTDAALLEQTGVSALTGEPGFSPAERIGARPTAEVNGIGGGYQGEGSKTVIPAEAFFKLSFRLVPDQKPAEILALARRHLERHKPPGVRLEMIDGHGGEPFMVDPTGPQGTAARRALERVFGKKPALMREGGSIPILVDFQRILGHPPLLLALASPDCRAHSPNENFPVANFLKGIELGPVLLEELAAC
jgi:acetylornithine deacetylase/succinyl-diaminopimelate desuccinylase-like protein